ncbi:hypothetical protein BDR04DRAFT_1111860 [Suillus decipiens]|nr:hypothetical protein BDR04DRAFT_1111860 [Suillus decipiens]
MFAWVSLLYVHVDERMFSQLNAYVHPRWHIYQAAHECLSWTVPSLPPAQALTTYKPDEALRLA